MDWVGPAVVAAVVSGAIQGVGIYVNSRTTRSVSADRLAADKDLAERKYRFDRDLAQRKFDLDVALAAHRRRTELAEEVLAGFLQMRHVIHAVRSPFAFAGEGEERDRRDEEPEELRRQRDTYHVPIARLQKEADFVSSLMSKRYRVHAVLGEAAAGAFQVIHEILVQIQVSAGTLMRMAGARRPRTEQEEKFEKDIWWSMAADDPLEQKLTEAVETIERVCRAILERPAPE